MKDYQQIPKNNILWQSRPGEREIRLGAPSVRGVQLLDTPVNPGWNSKGGHDE